MSGEPTSPAPTNAGPVSSMSGMQHVYAILGARDFGSALVGGAASALVFGYGGPRAVQFGAVCAMSTSLADAVSSFGGIETKIQAYSEQYVTYIDVADLVVGGAVGAGLFWYLGASGQELMYSAGIAGVAAAFGGKVSSFTLDSLTGSPAV